MVMRGTGFEPAQALSYRLSNTGVGNPENLKDFLCLKGCSFDHSDTPA